MTYIVQSRMLFDSTEHVEVRYFQREVSDKQVVTEKAIVFDKLQNNFFVSRCSYHIDCPDDVEPDFAYDEICYFYEEAMKSLLRS